ncbi:MAG: GNAT family N-acetyltransferase [Rubrobacter sp.]|nr:GNAT family N-acetyltransferase [Rubrobacter sp.]
MKVSIRPLENDELQDGIAELRVATYPGFPEAHETEYYASFYRWYLNHPLAGQVYRWAAISGKDQVVGHLAALPQYYRINGRRVVAHTPGDYMVLPGYGFQALPLMRTFFRATENCVACDMVPAVIQVETRLGAEVVGRMQYSAKLLNVSRLPVPALPERARKLLGLPARFAPPRGFETGGEARQAGETYAAPRPRAPIPTPVKAFLNRALEEIDGVLVRGFGGAAKVEELEEFGEEFDDLFEKVAAVVPCVPEKDARFLNWRYGPGSPQGPVTVLGVRGSNGLLGYAVLKTASAGQDGYILDLTTVPGYQEVARALLRESVLYFRRAGAHIIRYRFLESPTSLGARDLRRLAFFYRGGRRNTLLTRFEDGGLHKTARILDNWSYNIGDGEATFWLR